MRRSVRTANPIARARLSAGCDGRVSDYCQLGATRSVIRWAAARKNLTKIGITAKKLRSRRRNRDLPKPVQKS